MQTPGDDLPFITLSISELHAEGHQKGNDWVLLLFATSTIDLNKFIEEESFPSDFGSPLSPDYMFLPVRILKWQVEQVRDGVMRLMQKVLDAEKGVASGDTKVLKGAKTRLFDLGMEHLKFRNRWLFAKELATNLMNCFDRLAISGNPNSGKATYSKTLRRRVETQIALSELLKHDLETIPSKIQTQHQMASISNRIILDPFTNSFGRLMLN